MRDQGFVGAIVPPDRIVEGGCGPACDDRIARAAGLRVPAEPGSGVLLTPKEPLAA